MRFGRIETYLLMGGGSVLPELALDLKGAGQQVLVTISPRHAEETLPASECTLARYLETNGLEYLVSKEINRDPRVLERIGSNTFGLSVGSAWIFRKSFIDRFEDRLVNSHGERLPQDRGSGYSWHILRDNRLGCCLVHQVDETVDSGPIIKYKEFLYPPWCRIPKDYLQVYREQNKDFLLEFLEQVKDDEEFSLTMQPEYLSSYWPRLSTEHHGYLDWTWRLRQLERFICAFDEPLKGASTFINGTRVFLKSCLVHINDGVFHPYQTGIIYRKTANLVFVATEDGTLVIGSATDENGRDVMSNLSLGDRFYTPVECLEEARKFRAVYTPMGLKRRAPVGESPGTYKGETR